MDIAADRWVIMTDQQKVQFCTLNFLYEHFCTLNFFEQTFLHHQLSQTNLLAPSTFSNKLSCTLNFLYEHFCTLNVFTITYNFLWGLENAVAEELPLAEHRLCVKHLHADWTKRFAGKTFKEMMWEAERASSVQYHEVVIDAIRMVSGDAADALIRIPKRKWTRCGFKAGTNCPMLVNNWAEAFNVFIIRARDQPIITMLNTIYETIMTRLTTQAEKGAKWSSDICPRVNKIIGDREAVTDRYIVRYAGNSKHQVESSHHSWSVDIGKKECSCGLWQLGGVPCVHGVCVYGSHNLNPRQFVHDDFKKATFLSIYSHFLEPMEGPVCWPKTNLPEIAAPEVRVLPGRPKKKRTRDPAEIREQKEKMAEENARKRKADGRLSYKSTRKGTVIHCKHCKGAGHNVKTCPTKSSSQPDQGDGEGPSRQRKRGRGKKA